MSNDMVLKSMECICTNLVAAADMLNDLDAVMGDGEHGSNIRKCFTLVSSKVESWAGLEPKSVVEKMGMTLLAAGGGTATTLMGFFCVKCANQLDKYSEYNAKTLANVFTLTLESIAAKSKAAIGDKTLMDALVPAIQAFYVAATAEKTIKECFDEAANAAIKGAEATKNMIAKRGRGFYVGERGLGVADPGATSISIIIKSISETL